MAEVRTAIPDEIDSYLDALVQRGVFASKAELVRSALVNYVNETGTFFRGFDSENIFAPNGRIYQLEYAREAAKRGGTAAGIVCEDGVLLAAALPSKSKLMAGFRKLHILSDKLALVPSGLVADGWLVIEELKAAEPKTTDEAVRIVRSVFHRYTLERTKRPLGVAFLIASALDRKPRLVEVDPSGAIVEALAAAMGHGAPAALEVLEAKYRKMRVSDAERLVPEMFGRDTPTEIARVPS